MDTTETEDGGGVVTTAQVLPSCIALAGPTASGKTAAALAIAQFLSTSRPVEIISVDSALVYRSMDIGTAKPSPAELAAVPHHLIDIRDPLQPYSAAEFAGDARRLMRDITARGKMPLLVGGTMLYFKALFEGLDDMPRADPVIRAALEREAAQIGWPAMHAQLDPITAARLQPNDAQRVQRALEVWRISGKPLSSFHHAAQNAINTIANEEINAPAISGNDTKNGTQNQLFISLEPDDRAWLHERIAQRFDLMLASGFEQEVRALRARGDLTIDTPSIRCVGYRQMWQTLDASASAPLTPKNLQDMRDKGIAATRQLAKRQLTWLRSNITFSKRQVVACDAADATERVLALVDAALKPVG
ncbi:MAG: tRNA (adenosine(37)-N6)-dimethylallyltransferase MiaA [Burkholderiaceae bacterium]|nr:tRNA (adenosine(37)-N6)-dimethylallyltransferase MiaA [Burkholderiaceae bacterium]